MPTLTIRGVPDILHDQLKGRAGRNRRSLNAETLVLLEQAVEVLPDEVELRERFGVGGYDSPAVAVRAVRERPGGGSGQEAAWIKRLLSDRRDRLDALGVRRIGLFGSVLRGDGREESDIDLLVEFDPARKTYGGFLRLVSYLEDLLGRRVDLVTTEGLSPHIGPRILQEAEFVAVSD